MARVFQDLDEFGPYTSREIRPLLKEMSRLPKELIRGNKNMVKKSSLHIITKYSMEKDASIGGKIVRGVGKVRDKFISAGDNLANKYRAGKIDKSKSNLMEHLENTKPAKNQTGEVKLKREPTYDTPSTTTPKSDAPPTQGPTSTKPKSDAPVDTTPRTQGPSTTTPKSDAPAKEVKKSRSRLLAAGAVTTGLAGAGGAGYMYGKNQANTDGLYYE